MNPWYNHTDGVPAAQTRGVSQLMRNEYDLIQAGFDLLAQSFAGFSGAIIVTGTDAGAVNAYTVTPSPAIDAYDNRMLVIFSPSISNNGAVTLSISGLPAKAVKSVSGTALVSGDLTAGNYFVAIYNGSEFRLLSITKNYADQLAFNTALPAGTADNFLTTNGPTAFYSALLKSGVIRFADSSDTTKRIAFNLASITTGTTRTITVPDRDVMLGFSGSQIFTASGTFTPPAGVSYYVVDAIAGGAGGGQGGITGTSSGGGGGARAIRIIPASQVTGPVTVTVGAGGTGATGTGSTGGNGIAGGNSSFGSFFTVYGGGPGAGANTSNLLGGGGGGTSSAGLSGVSASLGGGPSYSALLTNAVGVNVFGDCGAAGAQNVPSGNSEWGGAGGGGYGGGSPTGGGSSLYAGPGGGGGGNNSATTGLAGGINGSYTNAGGAAGGITGAVGAAGSNGVNADTLGNGASGGGGGGYGSGTAGGKGGNGGIPGCGGASGGQGTSIGGSGGDGGRGEVRIYYF